MAKEDVFLDWNKEFVFFAKPNKLHFQNMLSGIRCVICIF